MASQVDALAVLCDAISSPSGSVELLASSSEPTTSLSEAVSVKLQPGNITIPKSQSTRYLKQNSTDSYYSLEALVFVYLYRDATSAEYIRHSREGGRTDFVPFTERNKVLEYMQSGGTTPNDRVLPIRSTTPTTEPTATPLTPGSKAGTGPSLSSSSPAKRRYVPSAADLEAVKRIKASEVELRDRSTVLRGVKTNNFGALRQTYSAHLKKLRGDSSSKTPSSAAQPNVTSTLTKSPSTVATPGRKRPLYPIIMISSSPTALITMWNVKKFLNDAIFETSSDAKERAIAEGNPRPEPLIQVYRRVSSVDTSGREVVQNLRYQIVDGVETLNRLGGGGADPWDRVVCVMTTGQAWQFRPYKWNEPRILFHHVKGIYVSWESDPPNPKIKDWNVTELKIDPHRRYLDKSSVAHFWKVLDDWVGHNKPWVMKT